VSIDSVGAKLALQCRPTPKQQSWDSCDAAIFHVITVKIWHVQWRLGDEN